MFNELDLDGGGTLDLDELTQAIKTMREQARTVQAVNQKNKDLIAFLQDRLQTATEVTEITRQAEELEEELQESGLENQNCAARLGMRLYSRGTKIGDIVQAWETQPDGTIDAKSFRKNLKAFGLEASNEELDGLFESMDLNHDGSLDLEEITAAFHSLREASIQAEKDLKELKSKRVQLMKEAKDSQAKLRQMRKADEMAEKAREEQEAKEMAERREAARAANEAKDAARALGRRRKEEEKKAFEQAVKQRREKMGAGGVNAFKMLLEEASSSEGGGGLW